MRVHGLVLLVAAALLSLPLRAELTEERGAPPPPIGPVRIILLDACQHAEFEAAVAALRTEVPISINTGMMDVPTCSIDVIKGQAALLALAKSLEAERASALERHLPVPLAIIYMGTVFEGQGVASVWLPTIQRLSRSALLITPGGNSSAIPAGNVWPASLDSLHVGNAFQGTRYGSLGPEIGFYLDFGGEVTVELDGQEWSGGETSTSSMLTAAHMANVLSTGAGKNLTPPELLAKLKGAFHGGIIREQALETRLTAALR